MPTCLPACLFPYPCMSPFMPSCLPWFLIPAFRPLCFPTPACPPAFLVSCHGLPAFLSVVLSLPACLPACLHALHFSCPCLRACLPNFCLPLPSGLPACFPISACLPACLISYPCLPAFPFSCRGLHAASSPHPAGLPSYPACLPPLLPHCLPSCGSSSPPPCQTACLPACPGQVASL
eukprot:jgi/Botrbrau1/19219/Bobra.0077s0119.1